MPKIDKSKYNCSFLQLFCTFKLPIDFQKNTLLCDRLQRLIDSFIVSFHKFDVFVFSYTVNCFMTM